MMEPGSSIGLSGYGYARIDDPPAPAQQNYVNNNVDFYDVIRDDLSVTASSDFDPNYESVPQTTVTTTSGVTSSSVNSISGSSSSAAMNQHPSDMAVTVTVASNVGGSQRPNDTARHRGLLVREHIYDEVSSPTTTTTTCTTTNTHSDV